MAASGTTRYGAERASLGNQAIVLLHDQRAGRRVRIALHGAALLGFEVPFAGRAQDLADGYRNADEVRARPGSRYAIMVPDDGHGHPARAGSAVLRVAPPGRCRIQPARRGRLRRSVLGQPGGSHPLPEQAAYFDPQFDTPDMYIAGLPVQAVIEIVALALIAGAALLMRPSPASDTPASSN